jgi:uroporphyrinogen-III synthase
MRILVTRPRESAEETAAKLRALGHAVMVAPLIEIQFADGPEISLENVQAILATSSNGVQALARRTHRRDVPLFAVGAQTARVAHDAGFLIVKSANGDAVALAAAVVEWAKPDAGALLHAAGAETKGQLAQTIRARGFEIHSQVVYEAVAVNELPAEALTALTLGNLDAVLLFSPRSARIFSNCVIKAGVADRCAVLTALCISQAASNDLAPLGLRAVHVAARPTEEAVLALLE